MSDYVPGRYTGFKNLVYWMATKRRNWPAAVVGVAYWLLAAAAVAVAIAIRGTHSVLPWAIGLGAFGLMLVIAIVLVGLSLHWGFALVPDRKQDDGP